MNKTGWMKGGCAALAASLVLAFMPLSLPTWAADSSLTTAARINAAVASMNTADREQVNMIANAMRALSVAEQKRLGSNTIRRLDTAFAVNNGYLQRITAKEGTVTTNRINKTSVASAGATVSAGGSVSLTLWQDKPSSSTVLLQFSIETDASMITPVIYSFDRPANISTAYDYYLRDDAGNRMDASVSGSSFSFVAINPKSVFKVYRGGKADDKDPDDPEIVTPFWQEVIDEVDDARSGDRLRFDVGTRSTVPADVLRALYNRSVWLTLRPSRGDTFTIYGRDLPRIPTNRDYYTMTSLRNLYGTNANSSSSRTPSRPVQPVRPEPEPFVPPTPVTPTPPPVYQPSVVVTTPTVPPKEQESSSLEPEEPSSEADVSENEPPMMDVEIEAAEDDPPENEQASSSEAKEATAQPDSAEHGTFVTLVTLIILAAGAGTALLTVALCARHKK